METGAIRSELDVEKMNDYIRKTLPEVKGPVKVKQFKSGQSNPTYLLDDAAGKRYVLRSKPPGTLLSAKAHAVEREYAVLHAIQEYNKTLSSSEQHLWVPVPKVYCLCEDSTIIGRPFYIMEFLKGRIFVDPALPELPKAERREYWIELVRTQAKLAHVPIKQLNLPPNFAPDAPYFARTAPSMMKLARKQAAAKDKETGEEVGMMPNFEEGVAYLASHIPPELEVRSLSHGDLKMDNVVFHPTEPRVIGILDWELCTIGAPIPDFANSMLPYFTPYDPDNKLGATGGFEGTDPNETGLPRREELEKAWCDGMEMQYPLKHINWAIGWQCARLAFILQGIAARYARRQASSEMAKINGTRRFALAALMERYIELEKQVNGDT